VSTPLGIAVPAVNVPESVVRRFTECLARSTPDCDYRLHVERRADPDGFRIARCKNRGILALKDHCRVIVCTDVDMLVPPGLVDHTTTRVENGKCVWALCRNVDFRQAAPRRWDEWLRLPLRRTGRGSWVAMTIDDWCKTGGWDERLEGWGGDDDVLALRRAEAGIVDLPATGYPLVHVNHPPRDGHASLRAGGNARNLRIGRTPPACNWLTGRTPIDRKNNHVSLFVHLGCNHRCPQCSQRSLMRAHPDYSMGLEEVQRFIECTKLSGYAKFRSLILSGGEPLLWPNLEPATQRLKEAGVAERINVFSNGLAAERITDGLMENVSTLRLSRYADNQQPIRGLRKRYRRQIVVVERRKHRAIPPRLQAHDVLPARCACEGYALCDGRVYGCPLVPATALEFGLSLEDFPEAVCALQPGYVEILSRFPRARHTLCRGCVGNLNLGNQGNQ
jgi:organic radical activating enzyme